MVLRSSRAVAKGLTNDRVWVKQGSIATVLSINQDGWLFVGKTPCMIDVLPRG